MLSIGHASPVHAQVRSSLPWLLACGALTGILDLVFAIGWWTPLGASPIRILQSVASWFIGPEAYSGGAATAGLGVILQVLIMTAIASGYYLASQRLPRLLAQPLRWGALYGACAFVLQHMLLIPQLSASGPQPPSFDLWTLACFVVYVLLVGIPCALFAREYARRD